MWNIEELPEGWSPIGRQIKGGQATVQRVRHEDGRKGIYRKLHKPISKVSMERFQRELEILSRKVEHRAIVTLFDWSTENYRPWYISELGKPFDRWWSGCKKQLKTDSARLIDKAVSVLLELSSALAICHDNGIVHRDIKPKNLVVKGGVSEPWPILIDFGIAHDEAGSRLTPLDDVVDDDVALAKSRHVAVARHRPPHRHVEQRIQYLPQSVEDQDQAVLKQLCDVGLGQRDRPAERARGGA